MNDPKTQNYGNPDTRAMPYETSGAMPPSAATGPAPNTAGPHNSDMLNKLDPRVDHNMDRAAFHQQNEGQQGPMHAGPGHDDYGSYDNYTATGRDHQFGHSAAGAAGPVPPRGHGHNAPLAPQSAAAPSSVVPPGGVGNYHADNNLPSKVPEGTYGPHKSRMANVLDPRVDSTNPDWQRDSRPANNGMGATGPHAAGGMAAAETAHGGAVPPPATMSGGRTGGGFAAGSGGRYEDTAVPAAAATTAHHGHRGTARHPEKFTIGHPAAVGAVAGATAATAAEHRRHEGRHGRHDDVDQPLAPGAGGAAGYGQVGQAPPFAAPRPGGSVPEGTYGPHTSRLANALDPRVDSDLDGSRTMGQTFAGEVFAGTDKMGVPKGRNAAEATGVAGQGGMAQGGVPQGGMGPGGMAPGGERVTRRGI